MTDALSVEIRENFEFFQGAVGGWLAAHRDRYALLRDRTLIDFFNKPGEAVEAGLKRFDDGRFSIQRVTNRPVDLGFLSYGSGDWPTD